MLTVEFFEKNNNARPFTLLKRIPFCASKQNPHLKIQKKMTRVKCTVFATHCRHCKSFSFLFKMNIYEEKNKTKN